MIQIPMARGLVTIVDSEDAELASSHTWHPTWNGRKWYAATNRSRRLGRGTIYLHRLILGIEWPTEGDHINGNSLDNRRDNLRPASHQQNARNRPAPRFSRRHSMFKGVTWCSFTGRWRAQATINPGQHKTIGRFDKELDAALAYDEFVSTHFGEFAWLNFPQK